MIYYDNRYYIITLLNFKFVQHYSHTASYISVFEVVGVVTQPPKRRKRKGKEIPSPVGLLANELDIPVLCPDKVSFIFCAILI